MAIVSRCSRLLVAGALTLVAAGWADQSAQAASAYAYTPITPTLTDKTITLTGHDLTIEQIVQVARYGAKVRAEPGRAPTGSG